jgi:hypothetical protein
VVEFYRYTEHMGRTLFDELDADGDGRVTQKDLERAMKARQLPEAYATSFMRRCRKNWASRSFGWQEFKLFLDEREPAVLRSYAQLELDRAGTFGPKQIKAMLEELNLPHDEQTADAMLRSMRGGKEAVPQPPGADAAAVRQQQEQAADKLRTFVRGHLPYADEATLNYGEFRNFLILLPPERLHVDPAAAWYESSTIVQLSAPPVAKGMAVKSAIAGASAAGLSTLALHPLDTLKTLVQMSKTNEGFVSIAKRMLGRGAAPGSARALYAGLWPAVFGAAGMHGIRTGGYEVARFTMENIFTGLSVAAISSAAAGVGTLAGTSVRIPCEVIKLRLQAGKSPNWRAAVSSACEGKGPRGMWVGTSATVLREVPFYMLGNLAYEQGKKFYCAVLKGGGEDQKLGRVDLIALGALSGAFAAYFTTPLDVIKTLMMTGSKGNLLQLGRQIVTTGGVAALFKGGLPRALWIAPVGAVNFGAYEIARSAILDADEK